MDIGRCKGQSRSLEALFLANITLQLGKDPKVHENPRRHGRWHRFGPLPVDTLSGQPVYPTHIKLELDVMNEIVIEDGNLADAERDRKKKERMAAAGKSRGLSKH